MSDDGLFFHRPRWRRHQGGQRGVSPQVMAGVVVGVALIAISLAVAPRTEGEQATVAEPATAVPAPTTPPCRADILAVDELVRAGRVTTAVALLEAELGRVDLCPATRGALERLRVPLALEELLARRAHPRDAAGQHALAQRLQQLWASAEELGIQLPPASDVALLAYDAQLFLPAKVAFDRAFETGLLTPDATGVVAQYSSTLYNLGYWWTRDKGLVYQDGLALLAASACIDQKYNNASSAAAALLAELLGPQVLSPPRPYATPLLRPDQECTP